jgi:hypothetical protein
MWQLELLSRVVPAFGALAKEFTENEQCDPRLRRDAQECYADLVTIGLALHMSCGEWASGFNDEDVSKLLAALDTRFPPRWSFPISFPVQRVCLVRAPPHLPHLSDLIFSRLRMPGQAGGSNFVN